MSNHQKITATVVMLFTMAACDLPDQVGPNDAYCTSGASVISVDDGNVSAELKERIYKPAPQSWTIHTDHPSYNRQGRTVLIPTALTDFPANTFVTSDIVEQAFFATGGGSVKDYFLENSWGQFSMTNAGISDWVSLPNGTAFYGQGQVGNDWTRNSNLFRDACQASSINWASVDLNGDRNITPDEAVVALIIPAGGGGANRPGTVSITYNGQVYTITSSFTTLDCTRPTDPRRGIETFSYNFPTIWHELGHAFFGLPDRYADFAGTGPGGQFDIMSDNFRNIHITMPDKMKIGWIRPKILLPVDQRTPTERRCFRFQASARTEAALVLYSNRSPDEYFIVENIYQEASPRGFTSGYTESGLAIWWGNLNSGEIRLVEYKQTREGVTLRPTEHGAPQGTDVLFKYVEGTAPEDITLLMNDNNRMNFAMRAVSPPGENMQVEF